jgi:hypothetical protein
MAELKTTKTTASVAAFIRAIPDANMRADCRTVAALMEKITQAKPKMWGASIVGFGTYHYTYASGREGDWPICGFSPRKAALTLYIMAGFDQYDSLMARLGRFKTGKSCLYVKRLSDVDSRVLEALIKASVAHMRRTYPTA